MNALADIHTRFGRGYLDAAKLPEAVLFSAFFGPLIAFVLLGLPMMMVGIVKGNFTMPIIYAPLFVGTLIVFPIAIFLISVCGFVLASPIFAVMSLFRAVSGYSLVLLGIAIPALFTWHTDLWPQAPVVGAAEAALLWWKAGVTYERDIEA